MSLSNFKEKIEAYWDLEDDEQAELLTQIRRYANTQKSKDFSKEVASTYDQVVFSGIEIIYEALSDEPKKWGKFFVQEYKRAFQSAETADNAFEILECLDDIGFADLEGTPYNDQMIQIIDAYLEHPNLAILYKAIYSLGDYLVPSNLADYPLTKAKVVKHLNHENWKIRYVTAGLLEDLNCLPSTYKVSFLDKLKIKFLNPHKM